LQGCEHIKLNKSTEQRKVQMNQLEKVFGALRRSIELFNNSATIPRSRPALENGTKTSIHLFFDATD
jgi:hypothetical protein